VRIAARTTANRLYHVGASSWPVSEVGKPFRGIVVKPHVGAKPARPRRVVVAPHSSSRVDFGAHNNDLPNIIRGLNERVFNVQRGEILVPTPQPDPGVWRSMGGVRKRLVERVCQFGSVEKLTGQQFVDQCPANKRNLYAAAGREYETRGWRKKDALIKTFVKYEKLNFSKKKDPAPRVIQPRSPVYNYAVGRFTRRIEADMYKALAEEWRDDGEPVVMKGMTVEDVATVIRTKWLRFQSPVAVGLDASRFDQHVSADALKWEHSVYNEIFKDAELRMLLKQQLNNKGMAFIDGHKVKYSVSGTRASGDMNTSLGNCVIMCTLVREYVRSLGLKCDFVNNGDDCVLLLEKRDLHKVCKLSDGKWGSPHLEEWFLRYGFEMEVEAPVFEFEHIVFCQSQPILLDAREDKWVMCRQPTAAFGKDAMSLTEATELGYRQWSYQVGVGGASLFGDLPIFGELYEYYKRNGVDSNVKNSLIVSDSGFMRMSSKPRIRGEYRGTISDDTRVSFYKAFGYTPSTQVAMEREISGMVYTGAPRDHSVNISVACGLTTI